MQQGRLLQPRCMQLLLPATDDRAAPSLLSAADSSLLRLLQAAHYYLRGLSIISAAIRAQLLRGRDERPTGLGPEQRTAGQQPPRSQTVAAAWTAVLKPVCSEKALRRPSVPRSAHWPLSDWERRYSSGAICLRGAPQLSTPAQNALAMPLMPLWWCCGPAPAPQPKSKWPLGCPLAAQPP